MLYVIRLTFLFSVVIDCVAFCVFLFTDQRGLGGYAAVLIYTAVAVGFLAGLSLMGSSTPRSLHNETLHNTFLDASARQEARQDREAALSYGLIVFFSAALSGLCGYALATYLPT